MRYSFYRLSGEHKLLESPFTNRLKDDFKLDLRLLYFVKYRTFSIVLYDGRGGALGLWALNLDRNGDPTFSREDYEEVRARVRPRTPVEARETLKAIDDAADTAADNANEAVYKFFDQTRKAVGSHWGSHPGLQVGRHRHPTFV